MKIKKLFIAFVFGLGLTLALVWLLSGGRLLVAHAASFTVDVTNDENDGSCVPGDCSLREAIIAANSNGQTDTITLMSGTYGLTLTGTGEEAAATGDLDITEALTIIGLGPGNTIIDASGVISDRVFDIRPGTGTVIISGVTIINGNVTGNGGGVRNWAADLTLINTAVISNGASTAGGHGGGVYVYMGSATLNGSQVLSNTASGMGGGIYLQDSSTTLNGSQVLSNTADDGGGMYLYRSDATLNGGQIFSNTASDDGGGVYVFGDDTFGNGVFTQTGDSIIAYNSAGDDGGGLYVYSYSSATLSGGQIFSNTATDNGGGGCIWQGSLTLNGGQIFSNTATYGGGVFAYDGGTTLNGTQVLSNTATQWGGGLYILNGSATLNGARVISNTASQWGGGLYIVGGVTSLSLLSTTVSHNAAGDDGGGLFVSNGSVSLINATVSCNAASDDGGGLYANAGAITVTYTTIASNTANFGGGAGIHRAGGVITMQNSIVANNGAANCFGTLTSNGHNLDSGATCGFAVTGDITDTDPLLGSLTEDSGTLVCPLLENSPAIDVCICLTEITTDQRGVSRPQGSMCDIGAYERAWQGIYLPLVLRE